MMDLCICFVRYFCRSCSVYLPVVEAKWTYSVSMVISDGHTVSTVSVGSESSDYVGVISLWVWSLRYLQEACACGWMMSLQEDPLVAQYLFLSLQRVLTSRTYWFRVH